MCHNYNNSTRTYRRFGGLIGSSLDNRSLPPEFESRRGHMWRMFHLWLLFIILGGRSAHLTYYVHKSGRKTSIINNKHICYGYILYNVSCYSITTNIYQTPICYFPLYCSNHIFWVNYFHCWWLSTRSSQWLSYCSVGCGLNIDTPNSYAIKQRTKINIKLYFTGNC